MELLPQSQLEVCLGRALLPHLRGQNLLPVDSGKVLKICHCTSNILQIQFKKKTCHGIQDLLEGGETGDKETSLESFIRYKRKA